MSNIAYLFPSSKMDRLSVAFDSGQIPCPQQLKTHRQFVMWRLVDRGQPKPAKLPFNPTTGEPASTTDPTTWATFDEACAALRSGGFAGIGFVVTASDPFVFIDLDDCRAPDGSWQRHAFEAVQLLPGAWECSQSGNGLHGVVRCSDKSAISRKRRRWTDHDGNAWECYSAGRFIAFGGHAWTGEPVADCAHALVLRLPDGGPSDEAQSTVAWEDRARDGYDGPADDNALIEKMLAARGGPGALFGTRAPVAALWNADGTALRSFFPDQSGSRPFDHSAADQALMNALAFWSGCNPARMERLFGRSALGQRDKWINRPDYRGRTVWAAISDPSRSYLSSQRLADERRQQQLAQNREIGDDAGDPAIPTIMTLDEMRRDLVFIGGSGAIIHAPSGRVRKKENAASEYAASLTVIETGGFNPDGTVKTKAAPSLKLWEKAADRRTVDVLTWRPGDKAICKPPEINEYGSRAYNTWKPLVLPVVPADWHQRALPFLDHVAYLVPIETERTRFLQWLAHIFQKPEELPHSCYLMVAEQTGIGRNTLASIITRALRGYVASNVQLGAILDGKFNGRLSRKLLATVDETREGMGDRRYQRANAFRSIITEDHRLIDTKYGLQSVEMNCCRWLMFSNHFDAIPFENTDRRVIVIENPTERASPDWYEHLHASMKSSTFIDCVKYFLMTLDISSFRPGEHATMNDAKGKALGALASEADRAAQDFVDMWPGRIATTADVRDFIIRQSDDDRAPNGKALSHVCQRAGLISPDRTITIYGKKQRILIVRGIDAPTVKNSDPAALAAEIIDARAKFRLS